MFLGEKVLMYYEHFCSQIIKPKSFLKKDNFNWTEFSWLKILRSCGHQNMITGEMCSIRLLERLLLEGVGEPWRDGNLEEVMMPRCLLGWIAEIFIDSSSPLLSVFLHFEGQQQLIFSSFRAKIMRIIPKTTTPAITEPVMMAERCSAMGDAGVVVVAGGRGVMASAMGSSWKRSCCACGMSVLFTSPSTSWISQLVEINAGNLLMSSVLTAVPSQM